MQIGREREKERSPPRESAIVHNLLDCWEEEQTDRIVSPNILRCKDNFLRVYIWRLGGRLEIICEPVPRRLLRILNFAPYAQDVAKAGSRGK